MLFYDITSRKRTESHGAVYGPLQKPGGQPPTKPIVTDMLVKYANQGGIQLVEAEDEDDLYGHEFAEFFTGESVCKCWAFARSPEGEEVPYREIKVRTCKGMELDVGFKATLTVYDNKPSIRRDYATSAPACNSYKRKYAQSWQRRSTWCLSVRLRNTRSPRKLITAENFA